MESGAKPKIAGGNYDAIDTEDGFVIIRRVPSMSTVSKGVKGAPENIEDDWLDASVKFGQRSYDENKIAYPVHVGHHDDIGLKNPEFAGYFKPVERGPLKIDGRDRSVVFCDYKLKKDVFSRMEKGELPFVSPEIRNWAKKAISSVALLDSAPPHFPFPMLTKFNLTKDPAAVFSAALPEGVSIAKFEDGKDRLQFDPSDPEDKPSAAPKDGGSKCCEHCKDSQDKLAKMSKDIYGGGKMESGKPDGKPVDQGGSPEVTKQGGGKMEDDPKWVARFALLEDKCAALEKKGAEREAAEKSKGLADKALAEDLKGYQIGEKTKAAIYRFAADGPEKLKEYIESVKEVALKDSPRSLYEAELAGAIKMNDPIVAKFGANDPAKMEKVAKFASDYNTLKKSPAGKGMRITMEDWIKQAMSELDGGNV